MKKMIFTAVAVLAFSGIASAKTSAASEVESFLLINAVNTLRYEEDESDTCKDEQRSAEEECLANGCSKWDAYYFGAKAWGDCMATR
jgi:hypothetical protein